MSPTSVRNLRACVVATAVAVAACGGSDAAGPSSPSSTDTTKQAAPQMLRGVSLSPAGFPSDFSHVNQFFDEIAGLGRGDVIWNGPWRDDAANGSDAGTIPAAAALVADASQGGTRFAPVAVFGWRSGSTLFIKVPSNLTNDWSNAAAVAAFRNVVSRFAGAYHPQLLFLGNESDFYVEQDSAGYVRWVAAYDSAYDAIKAASPQTKVGPVFSVEHMMGWGTYSGWTTPHTQAFTLHDRQRVDVVGLTLYPYLGRRTTADVPANYLDPVFALIGSAPIAITETGWPASAPGGPVAWQPGEDQQVAYVDRLRSMIQGHSVLLVNWLFLNPMTSGSPDALSTFATVSLRNDAGAKRPVYDSFTTVGATP